MWDLVGNPEDLFAHNDAYLFFMSLTFCSDLRVFAVHSLILVFMFFKYLKIAYHKVPKFSDARKLCCNLPKIQTKRPKLRKFHQNDANGIANSGDSDQTAPLGAV